MIVSHKHKFIFLKTNKTAGTSIEIALSKFCGEDDIITRISPKDEQTRRDLGYRGAQNFQAPFRDYRPKERLDVIVTNHDLALSDLALGGGVILPAPEDSIYICKPTRPASAELRAPSS